MEFTYNDAPQLSPDWFRARMGKVTASRLEDWMAVSKAKGEPLKKRLDYELELQFERQFNTSFEKFVSSAMEEGINFEDFARREYEALKGVVVSLCGCWESEYFVASPDGLIGEDGLLEIKILRDNSFTDVLSSGVPSKHWKQIQGQLWATGREWCDYLAMNLNTKKFIIIRVEADKTFWKELEESVQEPLVVESFDEANMYDIKAMIPAQDETKFNQLDSDINEGAIW